MSHPWSCIALGKCPLKQDFLQATAKQFMSTAWAAKALQAALQRVQGSHLCSGISTNSYVCTRPCAALSEWRTSIISFGDQEQHHGSKQANKNSLPQTLKIQSPFHQIYNSCRDPVNHRECRLCYAQDMMLVSASHAFITHYSPKFYLERMWPSVTLRALYCK